MSILAIRTQLSTLLAGIQGVARVYIDDDGSVASPPDCPAFIIAMRDPTMTAASLTNSSRERTWHIGLTLLVKPFGLGDGAENTRAVENFMELTDDLLCANFSGGGVWKLINKDDATLEFSGYVVTRAGLPDQDSRYWGFVCTLDITEECTVTMGAGS